jgi:hypothetical protein
MHAIPEEFKDSRVYTECMHGAILDILVIEETIIMAYMEHIYRTTDASECSTILTSPSMCCMPSVLTIIIMMETITR